MYALGLVIALLTTGRCLGIGGGNNSGEIISGTSSKFAASRGGSAVLVVQKAFEDQQQRTQQSSSSSMQTKFAVGQQQSNVVVNAVTRSPPSNSNNNNADICPAVKGPVSNVYIAYDPTFQAATLDEVVSFFVDPVTEDPRQARTLTGVRPDSHDPYKFAKGEAKLCITKECLGCVDALAEILKGRLDDGPSTFNSVYKNMSARNNAFAMAAFLNVGGSKGDLKKFCKKLQPPAKRSKDGSSSANRVTTSVDVSRKEIEDIVEKIKPARTDSGRTRHRREPVGREKDADSVNKISNDRPGVATPLDCGYKRGDRTNDSSQTAGLCNLCWSLRTLPGRYFPRYVNELSCDSTDAGCLAGYGMCRERYRTVDVLYNYGSDDSPRWSQYSINTAVACECRVQLGSALHNLVSR